MAGAYYQVGGWKADYPYGQQSWNPDYNAIWSWCGGSGQGLDMVFGILPNGASSLLIPTYKARRQVNNYKQAYNFLSLSPIHFDNVNELKTKMEWLKPKASGSKAKKGKDMDTSSANKGYYVTIASDGRAVTDRGWQRAAFEHSRILYQILRHDLDPVYLGLDRRYRRDVLGDVQFVALALNYWAEDLDWLRDAESLQLLDVGYTTFRVARNIDQGENQLVFGETHHLTCKEKSALKKKGLERLPAAPGSQTTSQTLPFADLSLNIQTLLTSLESSSEPVIILVYDEAPLRTDVANRSLVGAALQKLKVNISRWKKVPQDGGLFSYDSPRARSRSPKREQPHNASSSRDPRARPRRSRSPPTRHDLRRGDIHCVDVSQMINALNPVNGKDLSLPQMARCLGLGDTTSGWCAGTEAQYLAKMWLELAKGTPVDDQADQRKAQFEALPPSKGHMQSVDKAPMEHANNNPYNRDDDEDEDYEDEEY